LIDNKTEATLTQLSHEVRDIGQQFEDYKRREANSVVDEAKARGFRAIIHKHLDRTLGKFEDVCSSIPSLPEQDSVSM
jgi:hypothetical protein